MSNRGEMILATADALFGAITMPVVVAMFPAVTRPPLWRAMGNLVDAGALVPAWCAGTGQRVWLTARSASGRVGGLRKWLADSDAVHVALASKNAGTIQPPVTFAHAQVAGQLVAGYGIHRRVFDSQLHAGDAGPVADGVAHPEPGFRLLIEAERMVRQGPGKWARRGGLVDKIIRHLDRGGPGDVLTQHLVVAPQTDPTGVNFEQELDRMVTKEVTGFTGIPSDAGWWFLPIGDLEGDPTWHPVSPGVPARRRLPGIASRRAFYDAKHAANAMLDRARKAQAKAAAAGIPLPAGVTVLPASGQRPDATPATP